MHSKFGRFWQMFIFQKLQLGIFFIKNLVTNLLNKSLKTLILLAHNSIYKSYFYNKRISLCAVIQMKNHVKKHPFLF